MRSPNHWVRRGPERLLGVAATALLVAGVLVAAQLAAQSVNATAYDAVAQGVESDDVALRPDNGSATAGPKGPRAEAATGLNALYSGLGLTVPAQLVPRSERPGCTPVASSGSSGTDAVAGDASHGVEMPIVADEDLPAPAPLPEFTPDASIVDGHGMWLWQYKKTEGGDYDRMIKRAVEAGLDHVWIRVGDSRDGFYAKEYLDEFVPRAHAAGLRVIGWGFPFLHDPLADTAWVNEALSWTGPHGRGLDAYSPDIERETEGVLLSTRRVVVHLASIRAAHPELPIIATVYPATDWIIQSGYPYEAMAPYIDGFATMDYWACGDAGLRAAHSIRRLRELRPVHVIGQAFVGGRSQPPSSAETLRFLDTAVREGANGASWWVWQLIENEQWNTIASYPWHAAVESNRRAPVPAILPE